MSSSTVLHEAPPGRNGEHGGARIAAIDNLKFVLAIGVILGHVAMTYGAMGSWIFEAPNYGEAPLSDAVSTLSAITIALGALFSMGLFFLLAGLFSTTSLRRHGTKAFARGRLLRLGIPVLAYVLVVMPLLDVVIGSTAGTTHDGIADQYVHSLGQVGAGPLWFVAVLLIFSLVLALLSRWVDLAPHGGGIRIRHVLLAAAVIAVTSFAVRLVFVIDSRQILDLHLWLWPQCAVLFVFGVLAGRDGGLHITPRVRRFCGASAAAVVFALVVIGATVRSDHDLAGGLHGGALLLDALEGIYALSASLWLVSLFQRRLDHQDRVARWTSQNAFGAYVAQAPVLVACALVLHSFDAPTDLKFAILAIVGTASCFVASDVARRLVRGRHREQVVREDQSPRELRIA